MRATAQDPQRAPDGALVHYERHRPEQTTLYCPVQQHAASFIADTEASTGAELPQFTKDEFDAFLDCGILARRFLRLRSGACGHDKLLAFSCKRRGFCPSCGARRRSQTATHLVPAATPDEVVQKLRVTAKAARDPAVISIINRAGSPVEYQDAPDFQTYWTPMPA